MIQVGDSVPSQPLQQLTAEGMKTWNLAEDFAGKNIVVFAVPGAFTPTCSEQHLPGFIEHYTQFKEQGIEAIICLSVNDAFVMKAWGEAQNAGEVMMLGDGDGAFTKAMGLDKETGSFGGVRSQRYAMLINDGKVTELLVEEPKTFDVSRAEVILEKIV